MQAGWIVQTIFLEKKSSAFPTAHSQVLTIVFSPSANQTPKGKENTKGKEKKIKIKFFVQTI